MSLVRYTNKKTGWVSVYESTSYYDPILKQSRPRRKYIGYEDPITGEFVPSSGKPGRRGTQSSGNKEKNQNPEQKKYKQVLMELDKQRALNKELSERIKRLSEQMASIQKAANVFIKAINENG